MQPVLDCNQTIRMSKDKTLKKASNSHFVQGTEQIKQKCFSDFVLVKNQ